MTSAVLIPPPSHLDLPEKFPEFRETQQEALSRIMSTDAKFIIIDAPTGSGKSLIAAAVQRLLKRKMVYTATTKQLQRQFVNDFPYCEELRGRENYPTRLKGHEFPFVTAGDCTRPMDDHCRYCCSDDDQRYDSCGCVECPYTIQKRRALSANVAVLNTALFLTEANYVGQFGNGRNGKLPLLIFDEADELEHALLDFVQITFTRQMIEKLGIDPPKYKTKPEVWQDWDLDIALPAVMAAIKEAKTPREFKALGQLRGKLKFFASQDLERWVYEDKENIWTFKPIYVSDFGEKCLWQHAERFILMSATPISGVAMCDDLGIPVDDMEYVRLPSTFPKEARPVWFVPGTVITHKEEGKIAKVKAIQNLDKILDMHPGEKVLVHTVSYDYAREVIQRSTHNKEMITYGNSKDRDWALAEYSSGKYRILIAPSMERGVDLHHDLCRVIVVMKLPYPNLGDKQIAARVYRGGKKKGQFWYSVQTIRRLVQATGRGMRSEDDSCTTYILDGNFERLLRDSKSLFPKWWIEAYKGMKKL